MKKKLYPMNSQWSGVISEENSNLSTLDNELSKQQNLNSSKQ